MCFLPQITKQKRCGNVHQKRIIEKNITSHLKFFHKVLIKGWPLLKFCAAGKKPAEDTAAVLPKGQGHSTADERLPSWADGPFSLGSISMKSFKLVSKISMILISELIRKWLHRCVSNHWPTPADAALLRYLSSWVPWLCLQHSSFLETMRPQIQRPNLVLLSKLLHLTVCLFIFDHSQVSNKYLNPSFRICNQVNPRWSLHRNRLDKGSHIVMVYDLVIANVSVYR